MELKDLRMLEIGLELLKMEQPLEGQCQTVLDLALRVVQLEIYKMDGSHRGEEIGT